MALAAKVLAHRVQLVGPWRAASRVVRYISVSRGHRERDPRVPRLVVAHAVERGGHHPPRRPARLICPSRSSSSVMQSGHKHPAMQTGDPRVVPIPAPVRVGRPFASRIACIPCRGSGGRRSFLPFPPAGRFAAGYTHFYQAKNTESCCEATLFQREMSGIPAPSLGSPKQGRRSEHGSRCSPTGGPTPGYVGEGG